LYDLRIRARKRRLGFRREELPPQRYPPLLTTFPFLFQSRTSVGFRRLMTRAFAVCTSTSRPSGAYEKSIQENGKIFCGHVTNFSSFDWLIDHQPNQDGPRRGQDGRRREKTGKDGERRGRTTLRGAKNLCSQPNPNPTQPNPNPTRTPNFLQPMLVRKLMLVLWIDAGAKR